MENVNSKMEPQTVADTGRKSGHGPHPAWL